MFFSSNNNKEPESADLSVDMKPIEAIAEFGDEEPSPLQANKSKGPNDSINMESSTSSMIRLDAEASEGESLD